MPGFDYKGSSQFLSAFFNEKKLILYGATGGPHVSVSDIKWSIRSRKYYGSFLTPTGYLYEEPQLLLRQEVKGPGVYNAIIEVIARLLVSIHCWKQDFIGNRRSGYCLEPADRTRSKSIYGVC